MESNLLINSIPLKKLIDSLSSIIPCISIKFFTSTFEWIVDSNTYNTEFCSMIHRYPKLNVSCNICDRKGLELARSSGKPVMYKCHMGLMELTYPVFYNDTFLGVIFLGQFLINPINELDRINLKKNIKKWKLDKNRAIDYFERLPVLDNNFISDIKNILSACAYYIANSGAFLTEGESTLQKIEKYIDSHLKEPITLKDIANHVNLNPSYLSALYSERKHISLFKYIQKRRIEISCYYLRNTKKSISEISAEVGIYDQNYFTRIFKEYMHCTPSHYRNNWEKIDKGRDLNDYYIIG